MVGQVFLPLVAKLKIIVVIFAREAGSGCFADRHPAGKCWKLAWRTSGTWMEIKYVDAFWVNTFHPILRHCVCLNWGLATPRLYQTLSGSLMTTLQ